MANTAVVSPAALDRFQLGLNAIAERRPREAVFHFDSAEQDGHTPDQCAAGRWHCWMLLGDFERAWKESDSIAARAVPDPLLLWDNKPFDGKRLMVRCLHGLGDAIQFIRYAQLLRSRVASITVETHQALVPLFSDLSYIDSVVSWEDGSSKNASSWDQQIEVMELPRAFRTTVPTIPRQVPYMTLNEERILQSQKVLGPRCDRARAGLVWASSEWNPARSLPISELFPLLQATHTDFFSFQRGPRAAELSKLREYGPVHNIADHSPGILETAADLMNMDVVITVDTMAAHLAGALGKPVWLLLPYEADWRWMLEGESTPWYPQTRLFRQSSPGCWSPLVSEITAQLHALSK